MRWGRDQPLSRILFTPKDRLQRGLTTWSFILRKKEKGSTITQNNKVVGGGQGYSSNR